MDGHEIMKMAKWFVSTKMPSFLAREAPWLSADDATGEVCLAVIEASKTFDASKGKLSTYAFQAMRWRLLRIARWQKASIEFKPLPLLENPNALVDESWEIEPSVDGLEVDEVRRIVRESIREAIKVPRHRNMFLLHELDGMALQKIGTMYGISRERVRQIVERERRKVKWELTKRLHRINQEGAAT